MAEKLGYTRPNDSIIDHVDAEDKMNLNKQTQRQNNVEFDYRELGQRGGWIINESGLYSLIYNITMAHFCNYYILWCQTFGTLYIEIKFRDMFCRNICK